MASNEPFTVGQYVEFLSPAHREDPFRADEVIEVQSMSKRGSGKKISWRVRVFSVTRAASGWLDADNIQNYGGDPW